MSRTVHLAIGIVLLILAIGAVGFAAVASTLPEIAAFGTALFGVCAVLFAVPGILLLWAWQRATREEKFIALVSATLPVQRQLAARDLAAMAGSSEEAAEGMVLRALPKGRIPGVWDPAGRRLLYGVAAPQPPVAPPPPVYAAPVLDPVAVGPSAAESAPRRFCRQCGTPVNWDPERSLWKCPACGNEQ